MRMAIENFPRQCKEAFELGRGIGVGEINKVAVIGMGGSGFAGEILKTVAEGDIEVICKKNYYLPSSADNKTLVFAVSYSGNTEETLSAIQEAIKKNCKIIGIGSGGNLGNVCKEKGFDFIRVPSGIQPRHATGYLTIPMINVLQENGCIKDKGIGLMIEELKDKTIMEEGEGIAGILFGKIPLIYSSERMACLAYGWKIRFNEDAKQHAFANQFPELNHNEMTGYTKKVADFHTIIIRDRDDHERIKKRFLVTKKVIENLGQECSIFDTFGSNLLSRIFSSLLLASWASYYLALKNGVDPEPVEVVEQFKKELGNNYAK